MAKGKRPLIPQFLTNQTHQLRIVYFLWCNLIRLYISSSIPNYFFFISLSLVSPDLLPAIYFLGEFSGILI